MSLPNIELPALDNASTGAAAASEPTGSGPTGPRTPEGKARCRLNAFRHGLTGQVFLLSPADSRLYTKHHAGIQKHYTPVGPVEESLVDQIAIGIWRLQRCGAMEEAMFALDGSVESDPAAGQTFDSLIGPVRAWIAQGKSIHLLSTYEGRIRRGLEKDKAELAALQEARIDAAARTMTQAVGFYDLARREGKPYQPEVFFSLDWPPQTMESVFSPALVGKESARRAAWADARPHLKTAA